MQHHRWLSCLLAAAFACSGMLHAPTLCADGLGVASNSWQAVNGPLGGFVGNLSLSPYFATDHTLYAAAGRSGVYRSTDGGMSWAIVGAGRFCGS